MTEETARSQPPKALISVPTISRTAGTAVLFAYLGSISGDPLGTILGAVSGAVLGAVAPSILSMIDPPEDHPRVHVK